MNQVIEQITGDTSTNNNDKPSIVEDEKLTEQEFCNQVLDVVSQMEGNSSEYILNLFSYIKQIYCTRYARSTTNCHFFHSLYFDTCNEGQSRNR